MYYIFRVIFFEVTPCVGVWIETAMAARSMRLYRVTPCVGVWIETIFINLVDVMD